MSWILRSLRKQRKNHKRGFFFQSEKRDFEQKIVNHRDLAFAMNSQTTMVI